MPIGSQLVLQIKYHQDTNLNYLTFVLHLTSKDGIPRAKKMEVTQGQVNCVITANTSVFITISGIAVKRSYFY
jgi:hypothetical protein